MYEYKVLIAGLPEGHVATLVREIRHRTFQRYEALPEDPTAREELHRTFDAVFCFVPGGWTSPEYADLRLFKVVVEDESHGDPDYYDYTGDSNKQLAENERTRVSREIRSILKEVI